MRTTAALIATVLLLAGGLSGCLGIGAQDKADAPGKVAAPPVVNPILEKVRNALNNTPCQVPGVSNTATSANLKVLGRYSGTTSVNIFGPPTYGELDVVRNFTVLAHANGVGFTLVNVTDPMQLKQHIFPYSGLPFFASGNLLQPTPTYTTNDVKFNADGSLVFLGLADRIFTVYLTDRSYGLNYPNHNTPHPTGYRGEAKILETQIIGGVEYLFAGPGLTGTGLLVHKVLGTGQYGKLEPLTVYPSPAPSAANQPWAPSDLFFDVEAKGDVNNTYLYLANGPFGIVVLNVDDPKTPRTIAQAPHPSGEAPTNYNSIHVAHVDGKRLVVTSSDSGSNTLKVWDFTDLKTPKVIGQWSYETPPVRRQHTVQIVNGTVFLSHYAEGLFGFDLPSFLNNTRGGLKPTLHYQPTAGTAWDVDIEDGIIYVSDAQSVTALGFGCFPPGDRRYTSLG